MRVFRLSPAVATTLLAILAVAIISSAQAAQQNDNKAVKVQIMGHRPLKHFVYDYYSHIEQKNVVVSTSSNR
jgi:hypothetical protein